MLIVDLYAFGLVVYGWLLICLLLVVDLLTVACDAVSTGSDLCVTCWWLVFDGLCWLVLGGCSVWVA